MATLQAAAPPLAPLRAPPPPPLRAPPDQADGAEEDARKQVLAFDSKIKAQINKSPPWSAGQWANWSWQERLAALQKAGEEPETKKALEAAKEAAKAAKEAEKAARKTAEEVVAKRKAAAPKVGVELATKVARKLASGIDMSYRHRDDCGIGLNFAGGKFVMGHCQDGYPCFDGQEWSTEDEFVAWLAAQSDYALGGKPGNQRITLARLTAFLESSYSACR